MFDMLLTSVATVQENSLYVNHRRKYHCFTILHNNYYNKQTQCYIVNKCKMEVFDSTVDLIATTNTVANNTVDK